jgi:hypothetical protein
MSVSLLASPSRRLDVADANLQMTLTLAVAPNEGRSQTDADGRGRRLVRDWCLTLGRVATPNLILIADAGLVAPVYRCLSPLRRRAICG